MNWEQLAAAPGVERLGWTLIHFIWQGAAIGLALEAAIGLARRRSPNLRYAMALTALAAMLAAPVATYVLMEPPSGPSPSARTLATATGGAEIAAPSAPAIGQMAAWLKEAASATPGAWQSAREGFHGVMPWLVMCWMLGSLMLATWHLASWRTLTILTRRGVREVEPHWRESLEALAQCMGVRRGVGLFESALVEAPSMIGWLKPVILLPASAISGLAPGQVEAILAHELAHIRRFDYIVNLAQTVAETLLFYHPAVWRAGRLARIEREHCCDDLAVAALGDPRGYVMALTRMAELTLESPQLSMPISGGNLMKRMQRLMGLKNDATTGARWMAGAVAYLALIGCSLAIPAQAKNKPPDTGETVVIIEKATEPEIQVVEVKSPEAPVPRHSTGLTPTTGMAPTTGVVSFDFEKLAADATPTVNLDLDAVGIQMLLSAAQGTATENTTMPGQVVKALEQVKSMGIQYLRVAIFENLGSQDETISQEERTENLSGMIKSLTAKGWRTPFSVHDGNDIVAVMTLSEGPRVRGVTVVVGDGGDLILANAALDMEASEFGSTLGSVTGAAMGGQLNTILEEVMDGHTVEPQDKKMVIQSDENGNTITVTNGN